jgi:ribonuclease BN (tRNA processing enzyme)
VRGVVVLGTCAAWPERGRAASGFLLEYDGFRLVLDLGYATFPRLLEHCSGAEIDAVAITHEHPDHCADLSALCRERHYAGRPGARIPLYCTLGVVERVQAMEPTESLLDVFDINLLPGSYRIGPFRLDAPPLPHHVPHAGLRLTAPDLVVAYSGDAGPDEALAALGADADLFIVGATRQDGAAAGDQGTAGEAAPAEAADARLLSAAEAGRWATRAGARRLLLTHFWPGDDRETSLAQARGEFTGEVLLADEGLVVTR